MNEPITPEQLAQSVHEQLRRSGVAAHDLPWIMCPTEYQFRMQEAAQGILQDYRKRREAYGPGYLLGLDEVLTETALRSFQLGFIDALRKKD